MNHCKTKDLKSALNSPKMTNNLSKLKRMKVSNEKEQVHINISPYSKDSTDNKIVQKNNLKMAEDNTTGISEYAKMEFQVLTQLRSRFRGSATTNDLMPYVTDMNEIQVYKALENIRSRGLLRIINNEYPKLGDSKEKYNQVYVLNINSLKRKRF